MDRQEDDSEFCRGEPDPYTGRIGSEVLPGVYSGRCKGLYNLSNAKVRLFAYVYDPLLLSREMWECYLRLHMLSTFVHEAAHHYDSTMRVARGRWRMDDKRKVEIYAECEQHDWTREVVISYTEQAYPQELKSLTTWIEHHGGVSIPLPMLAGDPRASVDNGSVNAVSVFFSVPGAISQLAQGVAGNEDLTQTRLQFARELHYGERYELALPAIERVLEDNPDNLEALALKADIYEHQGRCTEAKTIVNATLAKDAGHKDSLWVMMDICEQTGDWIGLLNASSYLLSQCDLSFGEDIQVSLRQVRAYMGLGDHAQSTATLQAMEEHDWGSDGMPGFWRRRVDELKKQIDDMADGLR
jgi:tetratricopeptide (TPR) repeat protein